MSNVLILRGEIHDQQYQIFLQVEITNTLLHYMQFLNGLFQKKNKQVGGGWGLGHTFLKTLLEFFFFFYFTPGNSRQNKAPPLEIPQNFC